MFILIFYLHFFLWRNGPWPRISQSNTWTCVWLWWTEQPAPSSNYKVVERTTADRWNIDACCTLLSLNESKSQNKTASGVFFAFTVIIIFMSCLTRNGSRLSPTQSFVMWAVTSVWTAAVPGWVDSLWRSAAPASTNSGSSPSIYNHRGRCRPREELDNG